MAKLDFSDLCLDASTTVQLLHAVADRAPVLLIGPGGAGKVAIARRLATILPERSAEELQQATMIHAAAGLGPERVAAQEPFRAPHHTVNAAAMSGSWTRPRSRRHPADDAWQRKHGRPLRPGECSLAHTGVLLLDDLPEFSRAVLNMVGGILKRGSVTLTRFASAGRPRSDCEQVTVPAAPLLVACATLCACGAKGDPKRTCRCTDEVQARWDARLDAACTLLGIERRIVLLPAARRSVHRIPAPCSAKMRRSIETRRASTAERDRTEVEALGLPDGVDYEELILGEDEES